MKTIRIEEDLYEQVAKIAYAQKRSVTRQMQILLEKQLQGGKTATALAAEQGSK